MNCGRYKQVDAFQSNQWRPGFGSLGAEVIDASGCSRATENTPVVTARRKVPRFAERVSAVPPCRGDPQRGDVLTTGKLSRILKRAIRVVIAQHGVSVVVLPGEVVLMKIDDDVPECIAATAQRSPYLQPRVPEGILDLKFDRRSDINLP